MKKIIAALIIGMFAALPLISLSQPLPNQNTGGGDVGRVPVGAPIDGGLSILLLLGAGYGATKLFELKQKKAKAE